MTVAQVLQLQQERSRIYKDFELAFELFSTKEATTHDYQQVVQIVTEHFQTISKQIIDLVQQLKYPFKSLVQKVQDLERAKLQKTIEYQTLQTETVFGDRDYSGDVLRLEKELSDLRKEINQVLEEIHCEYADLEP